jgi:hypothetical protein
MEILKVLLLAVVLMGLIMAGLAIKILIKKGGQFPNTHISGNRHMKERGVTCAQSYDKMEQAKARKEMRFKELSLLETEEGK